MSLTKVFNEKKFIKAIEPYRNIEKALVNKQRAKIYDSCLKEPKSITELQKLLKIKSYKNVLNHLKVLEEAKLITRKKQEKAQGQVVLISSVPKDKIVNLLVNTYQGLQEVIKDIGKSK